MAASKQNLHSSLKTQVQSLVAVNLSDLILNLCPRFWHLRAPSLPNAPLCAYSFPADVFPE